MLKSENIKKKRGRPKKEASPKSSRVSIYIYFIVFFGKKKIVLACEIGFRERRLIKQKL